MNTQVPFEAHIREQRKWLTIGALASLAFGFVLSAVVSRELLFGDIFYKWL